MDLDLLRVALVVVVALLAVAVGRLSTRWQQPLHRPVSLAGLELPPGIVAFTSTQCDNCKRVMAMLGKLDVPVREVTHELEAGLFASAGVEAVPLLVITDPDGNRIRQLAGAPTRTRVRRALRAAGW